jgi:uncharacterized protein (DUF1778 family)
MAPTRSISKLARRSKAKLARLEARVSAPQKQLFERAAELTGLNLSQFMITALDEVARRTVRERELMQLTAKDSQAFVAALLSPPEPNKRLREAAQRFNAGPDRAGD